MIQTIITRQAVPDSPLLSLTLTSANPISELEASLSGNLADYTCVGSAPGQLSVVAKYSYKERLRRVQTEFREQLKSWQEKVETLERKQEILERAQVYSTLLTELNDVWWPQLPHDVRMKLSQDSHSNLPHTFASWFLQWEQVDPLQFPAPPSMRHFGPVTHRSRALFIWDANQLEESGLSKAIGIAWKSLPDIIGQLMLFCWAGSRTVWSICNTIAHPEMSQSSVKVILGQDFNGNFVNLYAAACQIVDYLF